MNMKCDFWKRCTNKTFPIKQSLFKRFTIKTGPPTSNLSVIHTTSTPNFSQRLIFFVFGYSGYFVLHDFGQFHQYHFDFQYNCSPPFRHLQLHSQQNLDIRKKDSHNTTTELKRYLILFIVQMFVSSITTNWLNATFQASTFGLLIIKIIVDLLIFTTNFIIQRQWIFHQKSTYKKSI